METVSASASHETHASWMELESTIWALADLGAEPGSGWTYLLHPSVPVSTPLRR